MRSRRRFASRALCICLKTFIVSGCRIPGRSQHWGFMHSLVQRRFWRRVSDANYALLGTLMVLVSTFLFADGPSVIAKPISSSINLDGKLDEPVWRDAPVLHLVQQS